MVPKILKQVLSVVGLRTWVLLFNFDSLASKHNQENYGTLGDLHKLFVHCLFPWIFFTVSQYLVLNKRFLGSGAASGKMFLGSILSKNKGC